MQMLLLYILKATFEYLTASVIKTGHGEYANDCNLYIWMQKTLFKLLSLKADLR